MFKFTATVLAAMAFCGAAQAQGAYPNKPIRLLVPFAAGGTTDLIARVIAEPLSRELGQSVVVENKGGGGGTIGAAETARAKPGRSSALSISQLVTTDRQARKTGMLSRMPSNSPR